MYLCRADGVSSVSVLLCRSGFPIIRLQNYFGNITSCLNRYYISVTTAIFYIVFSCSIVCLSSDFWKRDKHLI